MGRARGFTLIELMLVVAIIGLLAAISIPKFADLVRKSKEANVIGQLGAMRSALSIYYADNEGIYPSGPAGGNITYLQASLTTNGKYLESFPPVEVPVHHGRSFSVDAIPTDDPYAADPTCNGEFVYVSLPSSPGWGKVMIECYHTDAKSRTWSNY